MLKLLTEVSVQQLIEYLTTAEADRHPAPSSSTANTANEDGVCASSSYSNTHFNHLLIVYFFNMFKAAAKAVNAADSFMKKFSPLKRCLMFLGIFQRATHRESADLQPSCEDGEREGSFNTHSANFLGEAGRGLIQRTHNTGAPLESHPEESLSVAFLVNSSSLVKELLLDVLRSLNSLLVKISAELETSHCGGGGLLGWGAEKGYKEGMLPEIVEGVGGGGVESGGARDEPPPGGSLHLRYGPKKVICANKWLTHTIFSLMRASPVLWDAVGVMVDELLGLSSKPQGANDAKSLSSIIMLSIFMRLEESGWGGEKEKVFSQFLQLILTESFLVRHTHSRACLQAIGYFLSFTEGKQLKQEVSPKLLRLSKRHLQVSLQFLYFCLHSRKLRSKDEDFNSFFLEVSKSVLEQLNLISSSTEKERAYQFFGALPQAVKDSKVVCEVVAHAFSTLTSSTQILRPTKIFYLECVSFLLNEASAKPEEFDYKQFEDFLNEESYLLSSLKKETNDRMLILSIRIVGCLLRVTASAASTKIPLVIKALLDVYSRNFPFSTQLKLEVALSLMMGVATLTPPRGGGGRGVSSSSPDTSTAGVSEQIPPTRFIVDLKTLQLVSKSVATSLLLPTNIPGNRICSVANMLLYVHLLTAYLCAHTHDFQLVQVDVERLELFHEKDSFLNAFVLIEKASKQEQALQLDLCFAYLSLFLISFHEDRAMARALKLRLSDVFIYTFSQLLTQAKATAHEKVVEGYFGSSSSHIFFREESLVCCSQLSFYDQLKEQQLLTKASTFSSDSTNLSSLKNLSLFINENEGISSIFCYSGSEKEHLLMAFTQSLYRVLLAKSSFLFSSGGEADKVGGGSGSSVSMTGSPQSTGFNPSLQHNAPAHTRGGKTKDGQLPVANVGGILDATHKRLGGGSNSLLSPPSAVGYSDNASSTQGGTPSFLGSWSFSRSHRHTTQRSLDIEAFIYFISALKNFFAAFQHHRSGELGKLVGSTTPSFLEDLSLYKLSVSVWKCVLHPLSLLIEEDAEFDSLCVRGDSLKMGGGFLSTNGKIRRKRRRGSVWRKRPVCRAHCLRLLNESFKLPRSAVGLILDEMKSLGGGGGGLGRFDECLDGDRLCRFQMLHLFDFKVDGMSNSMQEQFTAEEAYCLLDECLKLRELTKAFASLNERDVAIFFTEEGQLFRDQGLFLATVVEAKNQKADRNAKALYGEDVAKMLMNQAQTSKDSELMNRGGSLQGKGRSKASTDASKKAGKATAGTKAEFEAAELMKQSEFRMKIGQHLWDLMIFLRGVQTISTWRSSPSPTSSYTTSYPSATSLLRLYKELVDSLLLLLKCPISSTLAYSACSSIVDNLISKREIPRFPLVSDELRMIAIRSRKKKRKSESASFIVPILSGIVEQHTIPGELASSFLCVLLSEVFRSASTSSNELGFCKEREEGGSGDSKLGGDCVSEAAEVKGGGEGGVDEEGEEETSLKTSMLAMKVLGHMLSNMCKVNLSLLLTNLRLALHRFPHLLNSSPEIFNEICSKHTLTKEDLRELSLMIRVEDYKLRASVGFALYKSVYFLSVNDATFLVLSCDDKLEGELKAKFEEAALMCVETYTLDMLEESIFECLGDACGELRKMAAKAAVKLASHERPPSPASSKSNPFRFEECVLHRIVQRYPQSDVYTKLGIFETLTQAGKSKFDDSYDFVYYALVFLFRVVGNDEGVSDSSELSSAAISVGLTVIDSIDNFQPQELFAAVEDLKQENAKNLNYIDTLVALCYGAIAKKLMNSDPIVVTIFIRLLDKLLDKETSSPGVQKCLASTMTSLLKKFGKLEVNEALVKEFIQRSLKTAISGLDLQNRFSGALSLAAILKGIGCAALSKHGVMDFLHASANSKDAVTRQGALFCYQALSDSLGILFVPYVITILPTLLSSFSDAYPPVRAAASKAASAVMSNLTPHGVTLILPILLKNVSERHWRSKVGAMELLGAMVSCAPRQLTACLPQVVPALFEEATSSHQNVKIAANDALRRIGSVITNPEIKTLVPHLVKALTEPTSAHTHDALKLLLSTSFTHSIDPPSLAMIYPILARALQERSAETKVMAAQIIAYMDLLKGSGGGGGGGGRSALETDSVQLGRIELIKDGILKSQGEAPSFNEMKPSTNQQGGLSVFAPYLKELVPLLKVAAVDPIPDVRASVAKAFGTITKGLDTAMLKDLIAWLMGGLGAVGAVERSGTAHCLSEVLRAIGVESLHSVFEELLVKASDARLPGNAREGYVGLLVYLPLSFGDDFEPFVSDALAIAIKSLDDEVEMVRDVAMRACKATIVQFAGSSSAILMKPLENGLFDSHWTIREASVSLLGMLLDEMMKHSLKVEDEEDMQKETQLLSFNRREFILSSIYIIRSDPNYVVAQTASTVWKSIVPNTQKAITELLPILMRRLVDNLTSESEYKQLVSGICVGELVTRIGSRVLSNMIPILTSVSHNADSKTQRGVCLGLSEIIHRAKKEDLSEYLDVLVPAISPSLCSSDEEVNAAATQCLKNLSSALPEKAILSSILSNFLLSLKSFDEEKEGKHPPSYSEKKRLAEDQQFPPSEQGAEALLSSSVERILNAIKLLISINPENAMPAVLASCDQWGGGGRSVAVESSSTLGLPSASIISNFSVVKAKLVATLAVEKSSRVFRVSLEKIVEILINGLSDASRKEDEELEEEVSEAARCILNKSDEHITFLALTAITKVYIRNSPEYNYSADKLSKMEAYLSSKGEDEEDDDEESSRNLLRKSSFLLLKILLLQNAFDVSLFDKALPFIMNGSMADSSSSVREAGISIIVNFSKICNKDALMDKTAEFYEIFLRLVVDSSSNKHLESILLPGLASRPCVSTLCDIFVHALMFAPTAGRVNAAKSLELIILHSSIEALKQSIIKLAGSFIRTASDSFPSTAKIAFLAALRSLVKKGTTHLKPMLPQLQTCFLKCLVDPSEGIRSGGIEGIEQLMRGFTLKIDNLLSELSRNLTSSASMLAEGGKISILKVMSRVICSMKAEPISDTTVKKIYVILWGFVERITEAEEVKMIAARGVAGLIFYHMNDDDAMSSLNVVLRLAVRASEGDHYALTCARILSAASSLSTFCSLLTRIELTEAFFAAFKTLLSLQRNEEILRLSFLTFYNLTKASPREESSDSSSSPEKFIMKLFNIIFDNLESSSSRTHTLKSPAALLLIKGCRCIVKKMPLQLHNPQQHDFSIFCKIVSQYLTSSSIAVKLQADATMHLALNVSQQMHNTRIERLKKEKVMDAAAIQFLSEYTSRVLTSKSTAPDEDSEDEDF